MQTLKRSAFDWKAVAVFKFIQLVVYMGVAHLVPKGTAGLFLYALSLFILLSALLIDVQHRRGKWQVLHFNSQSVVAAQIVELLLFMLFYNILFKQAGALILYTLTLLSLGVALFMLYLQQHHSKKA